MKKSLAYLACFLTLLGAVSLACGVNIDMGDQGSAPVIPPAPTLPPPPTSAPVVQPPQPVEQPPQPVVQPSQVLPSPTTAVQKFFTEEFDQGKDNWSYFITNGDDSDLHWYVENGLMVFDITGTYVYSYAVYEPQVYDNVSIEVEVANRGDNTNNVSLLCRYDEKKGWYEANIFNSGLYDILFGQWKAGKNDVAYAELYSGGSNAIKMGMATNTYKFVCEDNKISLFINGTKVRTVGSEWGLTRGQIGIGAASFQRYPVSLDFDWVKISEP